jgi:crotonobetainyl-CoA:carnitine CoA-transferase CaiB-like acyl-CoA transferase
VLKAFAEAGAAIAPVYDARDITEDPHIRDTRMLVEVDDPDLGPLLQHNVMWRMSESPGRIRFTGRPIGHDTVEVLDELGYSAEEISMLEKGKIVR